MADTSMTGKTLPLYTVNVEGVKIKELVSAIGDNNPIFLDKEDAIGEGYLDTPCPPTFFTSAFQEFTGAYLRAFDELGVAMSSVLHGEEEYEYLKEIYPGDTLTCSMKIESIVEKQAKSGTMNLITLRTGFTNQNGVSVARARSLIIERK